MSEPFIAEIRMFGFDFPPRSWARCDGQTLQISQNQSLFSLLGTMYGGDGETTFALPDLRGRTPMHKGNGFTQGSRGGEEKHTLTEQEMPAHSHASKASSTTADAPVPNGFVLAGSANELFHDPANLQPMRAGTVQNTGANVAHNNMQPSLALNVCIALFGVFPSRT